MTIATTPLWRWAVAFTALVVGVAGASTALAQLPSPPQTIAGSVNDDAGRIAEHVAVEAYVGDKRCDDKHGDTAFTGEGSAQVTYFYVTVLSDEQTPGCGKQGSTVRIKIGDRFVNETTKWEAGLTLLNVTFGKAKPLTLPTATPTVKRAATVAKNAEGTPIVATNAAGTPIAAANETPLGTQTVATIPAGSPGAGSPIPTIAGGITNATSSGSGGSSSGGGGFPLWGVAILVLGGIAVVGGGVGYAMSRSNNDDEVDAPFAPLATDSEPEYAFAPEDEVAPADDFGPPPAE
ncbi:MAG: hypothetical protein ABI305_09475 [Tepidiformaceae bacterium]